MAVHPLKSKSTEVLDILESFTCFGYLFCQFTLPMLPFREIFAFQESGSVCVLLLSKRANRSNLLLSHLHTSPFAIFQRLASVLPAVSQVGASYVWFPYEFGPDFAQGSIVTAEWISVRENRRENPWAANLALGKLLPGW